MYGVIVPLRWRPPKGPDADLDYTYDTTEDLEGLNDSIASVSASIKPSGSGELSIVSLTFVQPYITVYLAGGVAGRDYLIRITALTASGTRTFEWLFKLLIDPTLATWPLVAPPSTGFGSATTWP